MGTRRRTGRRHIRQSSQGEAPFLKKMEGGAATRHFPQGKASRNGPIGRREGDRDYERERIGRLRRRNRRSRRVRSPARHQAHRSVLFQVEFVGEQAMGETKKIRVANFQSKSFSDFDRVLCGRGDFRRDAR